jgi:hypothetical protein
MPSRRRRLAAGQCPAEQSSLAVATDCLWISNSLHLGIIHASGCCLGELVAGLGHARPARRGPAEPRRRARKRSLKAQGPRSPRESFQADPHESLPGRRTMGALIISEHVHPTASIMERAARRLGKRWSRVALWTGREGLAASLTVAAVDDDADHPLPWRTDATRYTGGSHRSCTRTSTFHRGMSWCWRSVGASALRLSPARWASRRSYAGAAGSCPHRAAQRQRRSRSACSMASSFARIAAHRFARLLSMLGRRHTSPPTATARSSGSQQRQPRS